MRVFAYDQNNPDACSAVEKLSSTSLRPGLFIPLNSDEFEALSGTGVIGIDLDDPPASNPVKGEANGSTIKPTPSADGARQD